MFVSSIIYVYSFIFFYALKAIWQRRRRLRKSLCNDKKSSLSTENIIDPQNEDLRERPRAPTPVEYDYVLGRSQEGSVVPSSDNDAMISMQEGRSPHSSERMSATDPSESPASLAQLHPEGNMTVRKHPRATSQEVSNDIEPDTRETQTIEKSFGQASNARYRKETVRLTDKGQPVLITSFNDVEPEYLNTNRSKYGNMPPPVPEQWSDSNPHMSPLTLQSFNRSVPEKNSTSGNTDEHGYMICFV